MCGPLAVPLAIAATAMSAGGKLMEGAGQSAQFKYQASIDKTNASLAEGQARDSIANTNLEAQRRYRELSQTKGAQQAAMGANGVDLNFGSSVDVQRDTAMIGNEDVGQLYKAGHERTKGFEINAFNYNSQATANTAKSSSAMQGGIFGALSTALGGASQISGMRKPVPVGSFG